MSQYLLASSNKIFSYVKAFKNAATCKITNGLEIKPKNACINFEFHLKNVSFLFFYIKNLSGNGSVVFKFDNFEKRYSVINLTKIKIPYCTNITLKRDNESTGKVALFEIHAEILNISTSTISKSSLLEPIPEPIPEPISPPPIPSLTNSEIISKVFSEIVPNIPVLYSNVDVDSLSYYINDLKYNIINIHCPGKVGEIFAAISVAKYLKQTYPNIYINWYVCNFYKDILYFCKYIDNIVIIDKNMNFNSEQSRIFAYKYIKKQNCYISINKNKEIDINPYYNYLVSNITNGINNKPFNEQFFDCLNKKYDTKYHPDIILDNDSIIKAEKIINEYKNFIIIFPYGGGFITPLSFSKDDYNYICDKLKNQGITTIITGKNEENLEKFSNCIVDFSLNLGTILHLFTKSICTIGVNSGIVFSSMFMGCNSVAIEDPLMRPMWNPNNILLPNKCDILFETRLKSKDVVEFIIKSNNKKKIK